MKWLYFIPLIILFSCKDSASNKGEVSELAKEAWINPASTYSKSALAQERLEAIRKSFSANEPFLRLQTQDSTKLAIQQTLLQNAQLSTLNIDSATGKKYLIELFEITKTNPGDISKRLKYNEFLYNALLYNFAKNETYKITVDKSLNKIVDVYVFQNFQPDLNSYHEKLATSIALESEEVYAALGYKPTEKEALMAATKTALNKTKCERSFHLCSAPTFIKGEKALWAIVDLTDMRLLGIRWTNVGNAGPTERITERNLLTDKVEECNCKSVTSVTNGDWKLDYILTKSDGLRVSDVFYKGKRILESAKLVDWHVSYSNTDGFGYSDAIGCPEFSQAAVTAVNEARVAQIIDNEKVVGFSIEQTFKSKLWPQPCNYNYLQRFEFYTDGKFRVAAGSLGRGCGSDGTYRPVFRIVLAGNKQNFSQWNGTNWAVWSKEKWNLQNEISTKKEGKYLYQISTDELKFNIEPSYGQFTDGGRGDNAFTYITKLHKNIDEGESDLMTIGPCCNTTYEQGPEKFINAESIENEKLVMWYVPQLKNDNAKGREYCWAESYLEDGIYKTKIYPCIGGPMFVPNL